jgi:chromate transport protein ChrA
MRSVYGEFGVAVAVVAVVSLTTALLALFGGRLPDNRWLRGMRFLVPGLATGLVLVFTLSATRVFVPQPGRWLPIVTVCAVAAFAFGYVTPSPDDVVEDQDDPVPAGS